MSIIPFPKRPARTERRCEGCGERFPKNAPTFWTLCRRCFGFASYRRAVAEMLDATRPRT